MHPAFYMHAQATLCYYGVCVRARRRFHRFYQPMPPARRARGFGNDDDEEEDDEEEDDDELTAGTGRVRLA